MSDRPLYDWNEAQEYLKGLLPQESSKLEGVSQADATPTQPTIGPWAAQLVDVLIFALRPDRVLEIGTSTGYSAIAMGQALQRVGKSDPPLAALTTIEIDPRLAETARRNIAEAGLTDVIDVVIDDANEVITHLPGPFGLILQDGNKDDYLQMLPRLVELLKPYGLLVTDDVLFPVMEIPNASRRWQYALGLYNEALQARPELQTVWLPIGDGVAISVKLGG